MITGEKEWSERDRTFAVGYQLYQQMLCPECHQPLTVCRDASSDGWFDVETSTCYATKAVQEYTSEEGYKPAPGGILYPVLNKKEGGAPSYGAPPEGWEF